MRNVLAILCTLFAANLVWAASFDERIEEGNRLLESGDTQAAMDIYRDLQIDRPDSGLLQFNMGVAKYEESEKLFARKAYDEAVASLQESRAAFEKAVTVPDYDTRSKARFSIANTLVREGKALAAAIEDPKVTAEAGVDPIEKHDQAVAAYENAISEYENLLKIEPDNKAAKLNRAHARYELKKLLQNPPQQPPPQQGQDNQQQQDQGEGDSEKGEDQQQNQGDQEGEQQQSEQEGDQDTQQDDQQEGSQGDPQDRSQQQPEPGDEEQEAEEEPFELGEMQEREPQEGEPEQQGAQAPIPPEDLPPDSLEALLQSIERQDNRQLADETKRGDAKWPTRGWW